MKQRFTTIAAALLGAMIAPCWAADGLLSFGNDESRVASDERLEDLRGGLSVGNDFNLSFGITRTISVNGEVVAVQGLRLNDVGNLFRGGMPSVEVLGKALTFVQLGPNNSVSLTGPAGGTGPSIASTGGAQPPASIGVAAPTFSVPGYGGSVVTGAFANAFATGIQNTLNDVRIQSRTQIDAQVAAFNALRSNFGSSLLRDNLVGSGAR